MSTISLTGWGSPLFDRFGPYTCDDTLLVPTSNGFYTPRTPLRDVHAPGESDIILGSDWVSATGATFCSGDPGILDPSQSVIASLPGGHHWSPNEGETTLYHDVAAQ